MARKKPNLDDFRQEQERLRDQHRALFESGVLPLDFYQQVRQGGASPLHAIVLLRDWFGFNLMQCLETMKQAGDGPIRGENG